MSAQQSFTALLVLLVLCDIVPSSLCIGLRITCPNNRCYGDMDSVAKLQERAEALRKLLALMEAKKMEGARNGKCDRRGVGGKQEWKL